MSSAEGGQNSPPATRSHVAREKEATQRVSETEATPGPVPPSNVGAPTESSEASASNQLSQAMQMMMTMIGSQQQQQQQLQNQLLAQQEAALQHQQQMAATLQQQQLTLLQLTGSMENRPPRPPGSLGDGVTLVEGGGAVTGPAKTMRRAAKKMDIPQLSSSPEDTTLAAYRSWRKSFQGYADLTRLEDDCSLRGRQQILRASLHEEWIRLWDNGMLDIEEATDDVDDIITHINDYIRRNRNPLLDRQEFHNRSQQAGESIDSYVAALRTIDDSCEYQDAFICANCHQPCGHAVEVKNERLRDRLVCGTKDVGTQQKLLEQKFTDLTLRRAIEICRTLEASRGDQDKLSKGASGGAEVNLIKSNRGQKSLYRKSKTGRQPSRKATGGGTDHECTNCGGNHVTGVPDCPAKDVECFYCHKQGHYRSHCHKEASNKAIETNCITIQNAIVLANVSHTGKEKVSIDTAHLQRRSPSFSWLPDPGAFCNAMSGEALASLGGTSKIVLTADNDVLVGANGNTLRSHGKATMTLRRGPFQYKAEVHIVQGCNDPLLSKEGCIALGFLPPGWPSIPLPASVNALSLLTPETGSLQEMHVQSQPFSTEAQDLMDEFVDVFPTDDQAPLRPMEGPPMVINLTPDAIPVKRYKAYSIPLHWESTVKAKLDELTSKGIIEDIPLGETPDWQHPMVVVPKKGSDEPRITVDFTSLNPYVKRPGYSTKVPREEVAKIPPGMKYFTTLDARHGYWQVPLAEESRPLTTFITPWGSKRFLRNAMGLSSAGDEHNRRGDEAIAGLDNVLKVVEDYLIYDKDKTEHEKRVRSVLERCRTAGITLGRKKFVYAQPTVKWCGYLIDEGGYSVNPELTKALRNFPPPTSKTEVRSFCGLVQQFEAFTAELAELMQPLRALLSSSAAFVWEGHQQHAFDTVIKTLVHPRKLSQFRHGAKLRLETDAAQSKGLGFALWQQEEDTTWRLLQCGSRFVTPTESRYSATEVELLAVVWAVRKCKLFLQGSKFDLLVDHRPLESILNHKTLDMIDTPRIIRLKEKLASYYFTTEWRPGAKHTVVDCFSRFPVDPPTADDLAGEIEVEDFAKVSICALPHIASTQGIEDLNLQKVRLAGDGDSAYIKLREAIKSAGDVKKWQDSEVAPFQSVRHQLSVVDDLVLFKSHRLVIPRELRPTVLKGVHAAHLGREYTLQRARECVFWPSIVNDIANIVRSCQQCQINSKSHSKESLMQDTPSTRPGEAIATDLFSFAGKEYLVVTDKYSKWNEVYECGRGGATTEQVTRHLMRWFRMMGISVRMTSDGGPPFQSKEFTVFCKDWGTHHDPSSPYHPQANGHAESAVKSMKSLMEKVSPRGSLDTPAFTEALIEHRNTPRSDGLSPAARLFGRSLRSTLPAHPLVFQRLIMDQLTEADQKAEILRQRAKVTYDRGARDLPSLSKGDIVLVQHPRSRKWDLIAEIVEVHARGRSYLVKTETGRAYWRNRKFLRRYHPDSVDTPSGHVIAPIVEPPSAQQPPRRSGRVTKVPTRFVSH